MKYIAAVDTFFFDRPTGSARVAWDIACLARDCGHQAAIFCRKQAVDDEDESFYEDIRIVRADFPRTASFDPFKLFKQKKAGIRSAEQLLGCEDWDLVHIHSPLQGCILESVLDNGPEYVYTVHSPALLEQQVKWSTQGMVGKLKWLFGRRQLEELEGGLLTRVPRIHTLSQFTKARIDEFYGVGHKTSVIPHWSDGTFERRSSKEESRKVLNLPVDSKILLTVRRLAPRMGINIAIKAVSSLVKEYSDLYFVVVGAGPLEKDLKKLAQTLDNTGRIVFLGRVDENTLRHCYSAADLFILPTTALECFGLITVEALSCGLPVISSDAAAIPEVMNPILPDCVVPAGNIEALRIKLEQWISNKLAIPATQGLIDHVRNTYSIDVVKIKYKKLLNL